MIIKPAISNSTSLKECKENENVSNATSLAMNKCTI